MSFPLIVGIGLIGIAANMKTEYEDYQGIADYPGLEWGKHIGNEHIGLTFQEKMAPIYTQTGIPAKHWTLLDYHNKMRRNHNASNVNRDQDVEEVVRYNSRWGSGTYEDQRIQNYDIMF